MLECQNKFNLAECTVNSLDRRCVSITNGVHSTQTAAIYLYYISKNNTPKRPAR